jgi:hypothetical protein
MQQQHSGSGDNVAGNKTTINNISIPKIIGFTLLGISLFVVGYLLWPDPVYLSGYVYSSGGQPVDGASLAVRTPEGDEYQSVTNGEGFFQFDRLSIKRATAGQLAVQAGERELAVALDTVQLTENGLRLQLPPGTPPFRISYYNLGAHAIDQVLQGKLKEALGGRLATGNILLPNVVNDYYQALLNKHGQKLDQYFYIQKPWDEKEETARTLTWEETFEAGQSDIKMLPGKGGTWSADLQMHAEIDSAQAVRLVSNFPVWKRQKSWEAAAAEASQMGLSLVAMAWLDKAAWEATTQAMLAGREAAMQAYAIESREWEDRTGESPAYLARLREEYITPLKEQIDFWNDLIADAIPPQLIKAELYSSEGCGPPVYTLELTLPELFLQVALLENISDAPITIDTFVFRTLPEQALRAEADVQAELAAAPLERDRLLPLQQLAPGERLVIPQYFYTRTNEKAFWDPREARSVGIRDTAFIKNPDRTRTPYVFGPVFQVVEVLLRPELFAFRAYDRDQFVLIDGTEVGSCPYAYTRADAESPWRLEDHLIYGRRQRDWEGVDTIALHQCDGQVLIREKDPETSYLRHVYLIVDHANGTREDLQPDVARLRNGQPDYHVMEQGDSILLRFPGFRAQPGDRYRLVSAGYYLPYEPDFSYQLQAAAARALE